MDGRRKIMQKINTRRLELALKKLRETRDSLERCIDGRPGAFMASQHARQLDEVIRELEIL